MPTYIVNAATGATGSVFIRQLAERVGAGAIICTVRPSSDTRLLDALGIRSHACELTDPATYRELLGPHTVYVGLRGFKNGFFPRLVGVLRQRRVRRALFMGSTHCLSELYPEQALLQHHRELLQGSGLHWTLCHPSLIYGTTPRPNLLYRLLRLVCRTPLMPVVGRGESLMQPVHASDLAYGLLAALDSQAIGREYVLAGPRPLPYREIIGMAARLVGRTVAVVGVSENLALAALRLVQRLHPGLGCSEEQVRRLREDKAFDIALARRELGYAPRPLELGLVQEAQAMRALGLLPPLRARRGDSDHRPVHPGKQQWLGR